MIQNIFFILLIELVANLREIFDFNPPFDPMTYCNRAEVDDRFHLPFSMSFRYNALATTYRQVWIFACKLVAHNNNLTTKNGVTPKILLSSGDISKIVRAGMSRYSNNITSRFL